MRLNGFRCDSCSKEHLMDPTLLTSDVYGVRFFPEEWYIVTRGPWKQDEEPLLFCSRACVRRHALGEETDRDWSTR
jgi:hypothetical protein